MVSPETSAPTPTSAHKKNFLQKKYQIETTMDTLLKSVLKQGSEEFFTDMLARYSFLSLVVNFPIYRDRVLPVGDPNRNAIMGAFLEERKFIRLLLFLKMHYFSSKKKYIGGGKSSASFSASIFPKKTSEITRMTI